MKNFLKIPFLLLAIFSSSCALMEASAPTLGPQVSSIALNNVPADNSFIFFNGSSYDSKSFGNRKSSSVVYRNNNRRTQMPRFSNDGDLIIAEAWSWGELGILNANTGEIVVALEKAPFVNSSKGTIWYSYYEISSNNKYSIAYGEQNDDSNYNGKNHCGVNVWENSSGALIAQKVMPVSGMVVAATFDQNNDDVIAIIYNTNQDIYNKSLGGYEGEQYFEKINIKTKTVLCRYRLPKRYEYTCYAEGGYKPTSDNERDGTRKNIRPVPYANLTSVVNSDSYIFTSIDSINTVFDKRSGVEIDRRIAEIFTLDASTGILTSARTDDPMDTFGFMPGPCHRFSDVPSWTNRIDVDQYQISSDGKYMLHNFGQKLSDDDGMNKPYALISRYYTSNGNLVDWFIIPLAFTESIFADAGNDGRYGSYLSKNGNIALFTCGKYFVMVDIDSKIIISEFTPRPPENFNFSAVPANLLEDARRLEYEPYALVPVSISNDGKLVLADYWKRSSSSEEWYSAGSSTAGVINLSGYLNNNSIGDLAGFNGELQGRQERLLYGAQEWFFTLQNIKLDHYNKRKSKARAAVMARVAQGISDNQVGIAHAIVKFNQQTSSSPRNNRQTATSNSGHTGGSPNCAGTWRGSSSDIQVKSFCEAACASSGQAKQYYCNMLKDWGKGAYQNCSACP